MFFRTKGYFILVMFTTLIGVFGCANQSGTTAKKCDPLLSEAEFRYKIGEPDKSLELIMNYIKCCKRIKSQPSLYILELLPLIYIAKNEGDKAKYWTRILLYKAPDFKPIRSYPPDFYKYLDEIRNEQQLKSSANLKLR